MRALRDQSGREPGVGGGPIYLGAGRPPIPRAGGAGGGRPARGPAARGGGARGAARRGVRGGREGRGGDLRRKTAQPGPVLPGGVAAPYVRALGGRGGAALSAATPGAGDRGSVRRGGRPGRRGHRGGSAAFGGAARAGTQL